MSQVRYYVYIMTNHSGTVLYTGVTNDLVRRLTEHRSGEGSRFTRRYYVHKLVYFETFSRVEDAIRREKQIKGGSRQRKNQLISAFNPAWLDLTEML